MIHDSDARLTEYESARLLSLSPRTLQAWRLRGNGPPTVQVSARRIRYRRADLVAWIEARLQAGMRR